MLRKSVASVLPFVKQGVWYDPFVSARLVTLRLGPNDAGRRIDRVARKVFPRLPLSRVYSALRSGDIRLNGRRALPSVRVAAGDILTARGPIANEVATSPPQTAGVPVGDRHELADRIVFRSADLLVVNKLRGELAHGPHSLETLVRSVLADSLAPGHSFTPGPVHRLDRNTTGLIIYAASLRGAQAMSRVLRRRTICKTYVAVVSGSVTEPARWENDLVRLTADRRSEITALTEPAPSGAAGQSAVTLVTPISVHDRASLVAVRLVTGRTHQIRAHAAAHGVPLLGDRKYGGPQFPGGYILHAGALTVKDSAEDLGFAHLWAPLPPAAVTRIRTCFGDTALRQVETRLARSCEV